MAKEKVCDDTSIELDVEPKAQWPLLRPQSSNDIMAPLPSHHILVKPIHPNKVFRFFLDILRLINIYLQCDYNKL